MWYNKVLMYIQGRGRGCDAAVMLQMIDGRVHLRSTDRSGDRDANRDTLTTRQKIPLPAQRSESGTRDKWSAIMKKKEESRRRWRWKKCPESKRINVDAEVLEPQRVQPRNVLRRHANHRHWWHRSWRPLALVTVSWACEGLVVVDNGHLQPPSRRSREPGQQRTRGSPRGRWRSRRAGRQEGFADVAE